jgi:hypothetical protein
MGHSGFVPDAYCGLYCPACPNYMNTQANPGAPRITESCKGCKSGICCLSWCDHCNLKACAKSKNIEFCSACQEYPCKDLVGFKNDSNYPYHSEVFGYLETIKMKGKETWLTEMRKRWSCPSCGTEFNWWMQTCAQCGKAVRGYKKPD